MAFVTKSEQAHQFKMIVDEEWFTLARRQSAAAETMARAIEADDAAGVRTALAAGLPVDSKAPVQESGADARWYPATWLEHTLVRRIPKPAALEALLEAGADPLQLVSGEDQSPALLAAFAQAVPEVVAVFRRQGPTITAFAPTDSSGWGPLAYTLGACGVPERPLSHPAHADRQTLVNELVAAGGSGSAHQKAQVLLAAVSSTLPDILPILRPLGIRLEDTTLPERQAMHKQASLVKSVWGESVKNDPATRTLQPVRPDKGQGWLDALEALSVEATPSPRRRRTP